MRKIRVRKVAKVLACLTAGFSLAWGANASATELDLQAFNLDPMVITATRTEMSLKENPLAVQVVDRKTLDQIQAKTLRDALKNALGVNVFNDFQGRSNVSIRGSESRHVLILVDGRRESGELSYNSANAWDVDRIRMEDVEKVEIIRGPAGALYGSDAIGGVINVITRTPDKNAGQVNYEYDWYEDGKGAGYKSNVYMQGKADNVFYKINAGLNHNRPYMDPEGSGDSMNFYGKETPVSLTLGYEFENGNRLTADFSRIKEKNEKTNTDITKMTGGRPGGGGSGGGMPGGGSGSGGGMPGGGSGSGGGMPGGGSGSGSGMPGGMTGGGSGSGMPGSMTGGGSGMPSGMMGRMSAAPSGMGSSSGMPSGMMGGGSGSGMPGSMTGGGSGSGMPGGGSGSGGGMPGGGGGMPAVERHATKTIYNDNKRTDFGLTYTGKDENQDWMLRVYRSAYDKDYSNVTISQIYMNGKPGPGAMGKPKISRPKHDTVKRDITVFEGRDSWNADPQNLMTAGFEYRQDKSEGTRIKKQGTKLVGDHVSDAEDKATINYAAAYVQDEYAPSDKWLLIPSIRYDWSDEFSSKVTSRLATTYNVTDSLRLKGVVGQGYKTPTVNELYHFWEMYPNNPGGPGEFFEGNPDLKPEKSLDFDIAVEKDFGENTTVHVGYFHNKVKDLIKSWWTGKYTSDNPALYPGLGTAKTKDYVMTYKNIPNATLKGVEVYGTHRFTRNLSLNLGYTYLDATGDTYDGKTYQYTGTARLSDRARHQVVFGLSYRPQNKFAWDCSLDIVSNFQYLEDDKKNSAMGKRVYTNKNFTIANIMTSRNVAEDARIYLGVDNISNHQNFGNFADGNLGRVFRFGMEYKF